MAEGRISRGWHLVKVSWGIVTSERGLIALPIISFLSTAAVWGGLVAAAIGVTFFVVPVLLYEELGVMASVKRSGSIFKERWGEQFTGNASIGLAMVLVALPVMVLCGIVISILAPVGLVLLVVSVGLLMGIGGAMSGVFNAALYQFATNGIVAGGFTEADFQSAFRPKKGGRSRS